MPTQPDAARFSLLYLKRGAPVIDSVRLRRRLQVEFTATIGDYKAASAFGQEFVRRTGAEMRVSGQGTYYPGDIFTDGPTRDVLDLITLYYEHLKSRRASEIAVVQGLALRGRAGRYSSPDPEVWRAFVESAFREENVGYSVDEHCVVHYHVDEEFERNHAATLALLGHPLLANARASYETAFRQLDSEPKNTGAAVWAMFCSVEIVARQLVPEAKNLYAKLATGALKERCLALLPDDETEMQTLAGMFDAMGPWIDAVHNYRHGKGIPEPVAPSEQLAVYVLSTGSAHLRLLAQCLVLSEAKK